jgi:hypothetical protein
MSADNYIAIQKRNDIYYVWMDFASNDHPKPSKNAFKFINHSDAWYFASGWLTGEDIVEYGIQYLPDYESRNVRAEENICKVADQIRKNIEESTIYGIPIEMNNVNHLIVAAYYSALAIVPKSITKQNAPSIPKIPKSENIYSNNKEK